MNNIMLDLETMSTRSNAAIIAIGAVFFNPLTGETGAEFYQAVDLASAAQRGDVDPATVTWWIGQSEAARAVFTDKNKSTLFYALTEFSRWIGKNCEKNEKGRSAPVVWGNGCGFDNIILSNAYKNSLLPRPWAFYNDRDVRTMVDIGRQLLNIDPKTELSITGTAHNALDDAKFQARYVSDIYKALHGALSK